MTALRAPEGLPYGTVCEWLVATWGPFAQELAPHFDVELESALGEGS